MTVVSTGRFVSLTSSRALPADRGQQAVHGQLRGEILAGLMILNGVPEHIQSDQGPEF